jgi:transglutaminase-like putative cysteine protease
MDWGSYLGTPVARIFTDAPKVYDMPAFDGYGDPRKLEVISKIAENAGRDPKMATLAVSIFRQKGVKSRDYKGQAAALLKWVQENIYYVNEPDERLQEPNYTLKVKYGDCDDLVILLFSLCRSVRLPCKLVISGTDSTGKKYRYHQGDATIPPYVKWSHIYMMVGDRPYGPPKWLYAEPTLKVALGWDVVSANGNFLPELSYGTPGSIFSFNSLATLAIGAVVGYHIAKRGK